MMQIETVSKRQAQAALEAIEVLEDAGFKVGEFSIGTEPQDERFNLDIDLMVNRNERPLED